MSRGELWLVSFDPSLGDEIRKTRPAVIISDDRLGILELRVVVPITAWQSAFEGSSWMIQIEPDHANGLSKTSAADAFQVKSVSTQRLIKRLGVVHPETLDHLVKAIRLIIGHR